MSRSLDDFITVEENAPEVDASHKLRIGIVGTGGIATAHLLSYLQ